LHSLEHELQERNLTVEQYLAEVGKSQEEMEAELRTELEAEVRRELVLDEIVRRQSLSVTGEEIEDHYRMMAAVLQQPIEQVIQNFDINAVQASLLQRKAVDWLLEHATVTDEE
jgi:trigger factor